ncbi:MAG: FGGY family carbohydrate kinase [Candidatus Omnitrophota bacterium]
MKKVFLAALDCGTSEIKAGVFRPDGKVEAFVKRCCPCIYHKDGRIEQDPDLILRQALGSLKEAVARSKIDPKRIVSVSLSSQRATVIPIGHDKRPIANAISWQDMRGDEETSRLRGNINDKKYYKITGVPNNPVFSLAKILSIKKNNRALFKKTRRFALIHDLILKELGCGGFFLDHSNASLTGMLDVDGLKWSRDILKASGIKEDALPDLVPSGKALGSVSSAASAICGLAPGTAIISGGGDQQCAGLGAGCVKKGIVEITLGTAGVTLGYLDRPVKDPAMRISYCAHAMKGSWEFEGLQNSAGASLGWIRKIINDNKDLSNKFFYNVSKISPGSNGTFFFPFLAGASAPNWNPRAKAVFLGLRHVHDRHSIVRSIIEGVSFETRQILDLFTALGVSINEIRLTGGCSSIGVWDQIQADIYHREVSTLENPHASLLGAAMLAGYGIGIFDSMNKAAEKMVRVKKRYRPDKRDSAAYKEIYKNYCRIYKIMDREGIF